MNQKPCRAEIWRNNTECCVQAYLALVMAMDWRDYIILYEDNEGLVRLQELLKYPSQAKDMKVTIRQLIAGPGNDYRYFKQW